ncbi:YlbF family regulator [uncultured Duncaniella sp.]|uniref:YlbF family regulator n=1 Tax=uncultured Duncaniella sp. TaxID=2768039 RepID=UPI0026E3DD43|nr:YlbF family regulator [uncultured Duncaniella sp.]
MELFDKMEAFEREYREFRENPAVDEFLRAELAFCRMMQEMNVLLTAEIDFE